jgi:hypothetical protein
MVSSEREMIRPLVPDEEPPEKERFTSLQPTYEDTVAPDPDDWDVEQD